MSKRQERVPLRDRLIGVARACTPTREEQAMVAGILLSMLVGAVVMHCRREYRLNHPAAASPTPKRGGASFDEQ